MTIDRNVESGLQRIDICLTRVWRKSGEQWVDEVPEEVTKLIQTVEFEDRTRQCIEEEARLLPHVNVKYPVYAHIKQNENSRRECRELRDLHPALL